MDKRYITKEDKRMANKHIKSSSNVSPIKEMQIKTTNVPVYTN